MKKNYLLLLLSFLNGFVYSQEEYYPIPDSNVYWTVTEFNYGTSLYDDFLYTVDGDTLVDNKAYKKVYKLNDFPTIYDTVSVFHCLMRQDTIQKKVWFIRTYMEESEEKLGYDFNLAVGDTVELPAFDFDEFTEPLFVMREISNMDISYLGEMTGLRKYYFLSNADDPGMTIEYIEGIVEYRSLFPTYAFDAFHQSFTWCMQQNGIYGYASGGDNEPPKDFCGFIFLDVEQLDVSDEIKLTPNPVNNYFNLELSPDIDKVNSVEIFNITGQIVQSVKVVPSSKNIFVDVSKLISGVYVVHINMNDMIAEKKIVVNH